MTKAPKPARRDAAATQRRILNAALTEFATHGHGGARIDRVAKAADRTQQVMLRINTREHPESREVMVGGPSKFGFDEESVVEQILREAARYIGNAVAGVVHSNLHRAAVGANRCDPKDTPFRHGLFCVQDQIPHMKQRFGHILVGEAQSAH